MPDRSQKLPPKVDDEVDATQLQSRVASAFVDNRCSGLDRYVIIGLIGATAVGCVLLARVWLEARRPDLVALAVNSYTPDVVWLLFTSSRALASNKSAKFKLKFCRHPGTSNELRQSLTIVFQTT